YTTLFRSLRGPPVVDGSRGLLRAQDEAHRLARGAVRDPAAQGLCGGGQGSRGRLRGRRVAHRAALHVCVLRAGVRAHGLLGCQALEAACRYDLPVSGESHFGDGGVWTLTGEWETGYLEPGNVMRGPPTSEKQRVTEGTGADAWLASAAQYDEL